MKIGNGVCDEVNKFESCGNYDGGDCQVPEISDQKFRPVNRFNQKPVKTNSDDSIKATNITKLSTNGISYSKFTPLAEILRQKTGV